LVTGGGNKAARQAYRNFQRFFGRGLKWGENVFHSGLDGALLRYLSQIDST
jgi:hypothetical protein